MSPEDVDYIVRSAVASARMEGMTVPDDEADMLRRFAADEISGDEYMSWLLARAGAAR